MQVTLTPHAEQLLRAALARHPEQSPETLIEQALAEHFRAPSTAAADPLLEKLKGIPGLRLPAQWPPRFASFEPIQVEGEPVSEQLIRERR
jgi:hypothetical protein